MTAKETEGGENPVVEISADASPAHAAYSIVRKMRRISEDELVSMSPFGELTTRRAVRELLENGIVVTAEDGSLIPFIETEESHRERWYARSKGIAE